MNKQQIFIYFLVGIMMFSAIGTGILLLGQSDGSTTSSTSQDLEEYDPINVTEGDDVDRYLPEGDVTELVITDLVVGDGAEAKAGDTVTVHYTGWLASDGTVFDSSVERGQPATFPLTAVIEGWQLGIPGMKEGGKRRLVIPSDMAYGPAGSPPTIPANADLVFEVDMLKVGE